MNIIINASTLSGTGVTQVAVSFIEECKTIDDNTYLVLISKQIASQLNCNQFPKNFTFYEVTVHPKLLFKGYTTRKKLGLLEQYFKPHCVFSVFGPSYWMPKSPHLMGYAYPHYVYEDSPLFSIMSFYEKGKNFISKTIHRILLKRNGKYYVSETDDVRNRLINFLNVPQENVFTVNNTYNHYFDRFKQSQRFSLPSRNKDEFRFLCLCSFAKHKNLEILNRVIPILNNNAKGKKVKFVLTVDGKLFQSRFSEEAKASLINLNRVNVSECPQLYYECDGLFLPTLLECFSANYPEAMQMGKPILTSNLTFATHVCQKAALYFDPLNPDDIAEKIIAVIEDEDLRIKLISEGKKQLRSFLNSSERAKAYLSICKKISDESE